MSKKNKPGYQKREALRLERRVVNNQIDQAWLDKYSNDAEFCQQARQTANELKPCTLGQIADKIGAPSAEAAMKLLGFFG